MKVDASGNDGLSRPLATKSRETVPWAWMASSNTIEEDHSRLMGIRGSDDVTARRRAGILRCAFALAASSEKQAVVALPLKGVILNLCGAEGAFGP